MKFKVGNEYESNALYEFAATNNTELQLVSNHAVTGLGLYKMIYNKEWYVFVYTNQNINGAFYTCIHIDDYSTRLHPKKYSEQEMRLQCAYAVAHMMSHPKMLSSEAKANQDKLDEWFNN